MKAILPTLIQILLQILISLFAFFQVLRITTDKLVLVLAPVSRLVCLAHPGKEYSYLSHFQPAG